MRQFPDPEERFAEARCDPIGTPEPTFTQGARTALWSANRFNATVSATPRKADLSHHPQAPSRSMGSAAFLCTCPTGATDRQETGFEVA